MVILNGTALNYMPGICEKQTNTSDILFCPFYVGSVYLSTCVVDWGGMIYISLRNVRNVVINNQVCQQAIIKTARFIFSEKLMTAVIWFSVYSPELALYIKTSGTRQEGGRQTGMRRRGLFTIIVSFLIHCLRVQSRFWLATWVVGRLFAIWKPQSHWETEILSSSSVEKVSKMSQLPFTVALHH